MPLPSVTEVTTLHTADGVPIVAAHDPATAPDVGFGLAIVVGHGFTGSWRRPAVRRVTSRLNRSAGVISLDFRGHGGSGGHSTVGDREVLDVAAAVTWARQLGYDRVAAVGFSMGASVVVRHAAIYGGVDAVVAVSGPSRWYYRGTPPMRRVHWVVENGLGRAVGRWGLRTRISSAGWAEVPASPEEVAGRIAPVPLLIVHGDADPYFPVDHAERLFAAAHEPKELWLEAGLGHAENAVGPELVGRIADWITAATRPPAA